MSGGNGVRCVVRGVHVAFYLGALAALSQRVRVVHSGLRHSGHGGKCMCEDLRVGRPACIYGSLCK